MDLTKLYNQSIVQYKKEEYVLTSQSQKKIKKTQEKLALISYLSAAKAPPSSQLLSLVFYNQLVD